MSRHARNRRLHVNSKQQGLTPFACPNPERARLLVEANDILRAQVYQQKLSEAEAVYNKLISD